MSLGFMAEQFWPLDKLGHARTCEEVINVLEASLPSLVTLVAPPNAKGTARCLHFQQIILYSSDNNNISIKMLSCLLTINGIHNRSEVYLRVTL